MVPELKKLQEQIKKIQEAIKVHQPKIQHEIEIKEFEIVGETQLRKLVIEKLREEEVNQIRRKQEKEHRLPIIHHHLTHLAAAVVDQVVRTAVHAQADQMAVDPAAAVLMAVEKDNFKIPNFLEG
jgi:predicted NodU family carbamoyl transferase